MKVKVGLIFTPFKTSIIVSNQGDGEEGDVFAIRVLVEENVFINVLHQGDILSFSFCFNSNDLY